MATGHQARHPARRALILQRFRHTNGWTVPGHGLLDSAPQLSVLLWHDASCGTFGWQRTLTLATSAQDR